MISAWSITERAILFQSQQSNKYSKYPHNSGAITTPSDECHLILLINQYQHCTATAIETATANAPVWLIFLKSPYRSWSNQKTLPALPPLLGLLDSTFVLSITLTMIHKLKSVNWLFTESGIHFANDLQNIILQNKVQEGQQWGRAIKNLKNKYILWKIINEIGWVWGK